MPIFENKSDYLAKSIFFILPLLYIVLYAPYGIENNDTGFILGYSWQLITGSQLYSDIIYVRPPISIYLHTLEFMHTFGLDAPVFISRVIFYLEIFAYSLALAFLSKKYFKFQSDTILYFALSLGFIFCVHNFPPMAWHTVDGIFFGVLGICCALCPKKDFSPWVVLGAALLLASALSKQPFYLIPPSVLAFMVFDGQRRRAVLSAVIMAVIAMVFFVQLEARGALKDYIELTSGQTSANDLINAGISSYASDFLKYYAAIILLPIFLFYLTQKTLKPSANKKELFFLFFMTWLISFYFAKNYSHQKHENPGSIVDTVFVITALFSAYSVFFKKKSDYRALLLLHIVAWSASISWGYQSTILFSIGSIITLAYALLKDIKLVDPWMFTRFSGITLLTGIIFFLGYQHPYNLEYKAQRSLMTMDMGEIYPSLRFIRGDQRSFDQYLELKLLNKKFGNNFTVLPSLTLAHLVTKTKNPIGIDWVMNAEVNGNESKIMHKLKTDKVVVFVLKNTSPRPDLKGKFGSLATMQVIKEWKRVGEYQFFDVYTAI